MLSTQNLKSLGFIFILLSNSFLLNAQVTIGSQTSPNKGALLDLKQEDVTGTNSKLGFLLPRVLLPNMNNLEPCDVTNDANKQKYIGLTVYHVGDCPGVYTWNSSEWVKLGDPCPPARVRENSPNCYIVKPGGTVTIPVGKPYIVAESGYGLTPYNTTDKVTEEFIWQDTQSLIHDVTLDGGNQGDVSQLKVTVNPGVIGNALVGVRIGPNGNDSDPIAWSWHIWVTDYEPDTNINGTTYFHNNGETNGNYTFMDRNLGATSVIPADINSMGMMYQWGRKDPFTASTSNISVSVRNLYALDNSILDEKSEIQPNGAPPIASGSGIKHAEAPVAAAGSSNLLLSIQEPTTFYHGPYIKSDLYNTGFNWYSGNNSGTNNNDLWDESGKKSPFDPCPAGWRIPAYSNNINPWYPYTSDHPFDGTEGVTNVPGHGYNIDGTSSRSTLGYYPSGFLRAPRAFFTGGFVGADNDYPVYSGGMIDGQFMTLGGIDLHEGYYWSATAASDNTKANYINIRIAGGLTPDEMFPYIGEDILSKSAGASVRCVKDTNP